MIECLNMKACFLATLLASLATLQGEAVSQAPTTEANAPSATPPATPLPSKAAGQPTRAERIQEALADFHSILQQATAAQIYVDKINMATGDVQECVLVFPAEEFQTLKSLLSRTKLAPVSDEETAIAMIDGDFFWLQFMDDQGKKLDSYSLYTWTSETRIEQRRRTAQRLTTADPIWYLSDADYEQLHRLPTVTASLEWYPWEPEEDDPTDSPESPSE